MKQIIIKYDENTKKFAIKTDTRLVYHRPRIGTTKDSNLVMGSLCDWMYDVTHIDMEEGDE